MKIQKDTIYTPKETQVYLKVSQSTMTRMLKSGLIRAAKVGKQYRIFGKAYYGFSRAISLCSA